MEIFNGLMAGMLLLIIFMKSVYQPGWDLWIEIERKKFPHERITWHFTLSENRSILAKSEIFLNKRNAITNINIIDHVIGAVLTM